MTRKFAIVSAVEPDLVTTLTQVLVGSATSRMAPKVFGSVFSAKWMRGPRRSGSWL
jgi:hypothetical protein